MRTLGTDTKGVAAVEFAVVAPVFLALMFGVFDLTRGISVWNQTINAAQAIVQAAEKMSVPANLSSGTTALTATQMQNAMSTLYAVIPGLNMGTNGAYNGSYSVTLSSIVYLPICQTTSGCAPQKPYVLWSSYLTEGGSSLTKVSTNVTPLLRACGALTPVSQFPNDSTQLTNMLDPTKVTGGQTMTLLPQVVADVSYTYTSLFSKFIAPITFHASATAPAPLGGTQQAITFASNNNNGNVETCTTP